MGEQRKKTAQTWSSVIVGRNPVREALERDEGRIEKVLIQQGASGSALQQVRQAARKAGVPVQVVPAAKLNRLVPQVNHQGVVGIAAPVDYLDVDTLLNRIAPDLETVRVRKPVVLVLDQIEDPHNYGAILRSAVAAGVNGVIVPTRRMAPMSAATIKASAGTALRIPVARAQNLADVLQQLKERGYWVAGAAGDGEVSMWDMDWDRPLALVIGNEEKGMRRRVAELCDYRVAIPMRGDAESLNASVAAGILLFVATRTRLTG